MIFITSTGSYMKFILASLTPKMLARTLKMVNLESPGPLENEKSLS